MQVSAPFYARCREEWRDHLSKIYRREREVWLVFPSKASGEESVSYNDAVEEALCFGWIDGQAGTLDASHGVRRFTPRRKGSAYSRPNIERLLWLEGQGMLIPEVQEQVHELIHSPFVYPQDIMEAMQEDSVVWENYQRFSESYKRIRIAYIDGARKRPKEFGKRLHSFIQKTREGKIITGYGGIEKYYLQ